jgi:hypothetical protein
MARFTDEGFVAEDQCEFAFLPGRLLLVGRILRLDGIVLEVEKEIAILAGEGMTARVQTATFRYHAWIRGEHNILRYESPHGHRPAAHKHVYNTFGDGLEAEVLDLNREDDIPTLGDVLRELQSWHEENASRIVRLR